MLFEYLKQLVETQDGKILFILALIALAMTFDFLTGVASARINPNLQPNSKIGINGILRKISSLTLMIFFIPVSVLIPYDAGVAVLYTLYVGYLVMELMSILENFEKMGIDIKLFDEFLTIIRGKLKEKEDETAE